VPQYFAATLSTGTCSASAGFNYSTYSYRTGNTSTPKKKYFFGIYLSSSFSPPPRIHSFLDFPWLACLLVG
jgi:hypothetical protein